MKSEEKPDNLESRDLSAVHGSCCWSKFQVRQLCLFDHVAKMGNSLDIRFPELFMHQSAGFSCKNWRRRFGRPRLRHTNCLLTRAVDGRIVRCGIILISCHFWVCKSASCPEFVSRKKRNYRTWLRTLEADLQPLNHGLNSAWRLAQDQWRWKQLVETATLQWAPVRGMSVIMINDDGNRTVCKHWDNHNDINLVTYCVSNIRLFLVVVGDTFCWTTQL